jgi:hypothetical protein
MRGAGGICALSSCDQNTVIAVEFRALSLFQELKTRLIFGARTSKIQRSNLIGQKTPELQV